MSADDTVDVLDDQSRLTGRHISKREAHEQGIWHGGTHIWIYNTKGELLLQLRDPHKDIYPGTWDISAAGHINAGELPEQTALRETEEELGLQLTQKDLRFVGITRTDKLIPPANWMHRAFDWTYIVQQDVAITQLRMQAGETVEARWISLDEFETDVRDPERAKKYSPRPLYLYDLALSEIRKALAKVRP
jgi:isopentenyldiphosphate isomerase